MRIVLFTLALAVATPSLSAGQSASDVAEGKKLFGGLCVTCHGFDGTGGGAPPLNRPRLLSAPDDASLRNVIAEGIPNRGMPRVRRVTDDEMRQLVAYVKSLGKSTRVAVQGRCDSGRTTLCQAGMRQLSHHQRDRRKPRSRADQHRLAARSRLLASGGARAGRPAPSGKSGDSSAGIQRFLPVTVVTRDGAEVRGVRLNEDVFTIQLRDVTGKFLSVRKSDAAVIRKETGASLMPSFANRLVASEIDDLVAYLSRLGGAL